MIALQKIALRRIAPATVALLYWVGTGAALAQTASNAGSPDSQEQFVPQRSVPTTPRLNSAGLESAIEVAPVSQDATQNITPNCPAGQFASAFPDVPPDHWAFTAVNRLAAIPTRCFPVSPQL